MWRINNVRAVVAAVFLGLVGTCTTPGGFYSDSHPSHDLREALVSYGVDVFQVLLIGSILIAVVVVVASWVLELPPRND